MKMLKFLIAVMFKKLIYGFSLKPICNETKLVEGFLGSFFEHFNSDETLQPNDVVLFQVGAFKTSKHEVKCIFDAVTKTIPKQNVVVIPNLKTTSSNRKMAVTIIVSDLYEKVSYDKLFFTF